MANIELMKTNLVKNEEKLAKKVALLAKYESRKAKHSAEWEKLYGESFDDSMKFIYSSYEFMDIINPNAESATDIDMDELCIIMWIEGYLRCKKENQNIIENMMNEGKSASEIFSRLVGKDYVYDEETKTRSFKE